MAALHHLWRNLIVQKQVIGAIMMRELVTRWGRRNLGFAWLFCEPLVFAFPVIAVWSYVRAPFEHGIPLVAFVWSAYMPILVFRHVTGLALNSLRANTALFYHRRVTPLALFVGRQGLEALGNLASVIVSFIILFIIGAIAAPYNYELLLLGFLYTSWWSLSIALIVAALSERSELVSHIWPPISYLYMFYAGFFWMADWLPAKLLPVMMLIDPPMHCYELIRYGLFGNLMRPHYNLQYLNFILPGLTFIGLWLMRDVRKYLEIE
jgi:capsular polysaccharide transport system permease protein